MTMTPDEMREEMKRGIDSLLDLVFSQSACETPLYSRSEAFELIHAALRVCSVSAESTLAAYATPTILDMLGLKFWISTSTKRRSAAEPFGRSTSMRNRIETPEFRAQVSG